MADSKLTALTALTTVTGDDLLYVVDDPAGTPTSKKATAAVVREFANMAQATGTDANTTMAVNTLYTVDMSAWATADRTYTLPATAAVGDRIGIMVTAGDASHELIITAGTGDTLNGISGGTEWSRLFITNEVVIMRCVVANATWIVEYDGRIPMVGLLRLTTAATGEAAATYTAPASSGGAWTADVDIGSITSTSNGTFTPRRACRANMVCTGKAGAAVADGQYFGVRIYKNSTDSYGIPLLYSSGASQFSTVMTLVGALPCAADDVFAYNYRSQAGSIGLQSSATVANTIPTLFSFEEILKS